MRAFILQNIAVASLCSLIGAAEAPATEAVGLPSAEAILDHHAAAHGLDRDKPRSGALHLVAELEAFGLKGSYESWSEHPMRSWVRVELGPLVVESAFDGQSGWIRDRNGAVRAAAGAELAGLELDAILATGAYVLKKPPLPLRRSIRLMDTNRLELRLTPSSGETQILELDARTHRLERSVWNNGQSDEATRYSEYHWVEGELLAHRLHTELGENMQLVATVTRVERVEAQGSDFYSRPEQITAGGASLVGTAKSKMLRRAGHILLEGQIGELSGVFLLDSGAGSNLLHSGALDDLNLDAEGSIEALGTGGVAEASFVDIDSVRVGSLLLTHQNWMSVDFTALERALGIELLGVLGYDSFREFVTHVDYAGDTVEFLSPSEFKANEDAVPIPIRLDSNIPTALVRVNGHEAWMHIDTGSDNTLDLAAPFVEQHDLLKGQEDLATSNLLGLGGAGKSLAGEVAELRIGPFVHRKLSAYFHDATDGVFQNRHVAGILGAAVLQDYECWFDYPGRTLWLRPVSERVFADDRSNAAGLRLWSTEHGLTVREVDDGSPAARARIRPGDVVIGFNDREFVPGDEDALLNALDGRAGTALKLHLLRGDQSHHRRLLLDPLD